MEADPTGQNSLGAWQFHKILLKEEKKLGVKGSGKRNDECGREVKKRVSRVF
jgi:hypothetical protein